MPIASHDLRDLACVESVNVYGNEKKLFNTIIERYFVLFCAVISIIMM